MFKALQLGNQETDFEQLQTPFGIRIHSPSQKGMQTLCWFLQKETGIKMTWLQCAGGHMLTMQELLLLLKSGDLETFQGTQYGLLIVEIEYNRREAASRQWPLW